MTTLRFYPYCTINLMRKVDTRMSIVVVQSFVAGVCVESVCPPSSANIQQWAKSLAETQKQACNETVMALNGITVLHQTHSW